MTKKKTFKTKIGQLPYRLNPALDMDELIDPALDALKDFLDEGADAWEGIYIDYEPPFLMRLYRSFEVTSPVDDKKRTVFLSLHYFFAPPNEGDADRLGLVNPYSKRPDLVGQENKNNYHPHPWAAAFYLFKGAYKQELGFARELGYSDDPQSNLRPKPYDVSFQSAKSPTRRSYAFNNPYQWHRVLPSMGDVATMMVTYRPEGWDQVGPKPKEKQRCLTKTEKEFMITYFKALIKKQEPSIKSSLQNKLKP